MNVGPGQIVSAKAYNDLLRFVKASQISGGPGTRVSRSASGTTVSSQVTAASAPAKSAKLVHPFLITDTTAAGAANVSVRYGTVNDVDVTDIATDLSLTSAAVWRVYLDCTLDVSGTVTAVTVTAALGAQPANTSTHAYITLGLATVVADGSDLSVSEIDQAATHSLRFYACGRVVTDGAVTTDGTYSFWGF